MLQMFQVLVRYYFTWSRQQKVFLLYYLYSLILYHRVNSPSNANICLRRLSHMPDAAKTVLMIVTGFHRCPRSCHWITHQQMSLDYTGHLHTGRAALQPLKFCSFTAVEDLTHSYMQESNIQYDW